MWKNNDCPCTKDCPDRWVKVDGATPLTCHGTCPKYKAWAEKRASEKQAHALKRERYAMTDSKKKAIQKSFRRDNSRYYKKFSQ